VQHVVSDVMPIVDAATANGIVTAGALIGIACCYPVFGWLMDRLTWPWAFIVSGAALIAYGVVWRRFASPSLPGPHPVSSVKDAEANAAAARADASRQSLAVDASRAAYSYQYLFFYWMNYYFESVLHVPPSNRESNVLHLVGTGSRMAIGGLSSMICNLRHDRDVGDPKTGMAWGQHGLIGVNVIGYWNVVLCLRSRWEHWGNV
jgi:MFS family permease